MNNLLTKYYKVTQKIKYLVLLILYFLFLPGGIINCYGQYTPVKLALVVVGDGNNPLSNQAAPVFVKEFNLTGLLQGGTLRTSLPAVATSGLTSVDRALTLGGNGVTEGFLNLSTNGQFLTLAGYNTTIGSPSGSNSSATTFPTNTRVVGKIGIGGTVDTKTTLFTSYSTKAIRSAVTTDGTGYWTAGDPGTIGVGYVPNGNITTPVNLVGTNTRGIGIFNNQLYTSTGSGNLRLATVGLGLPTSGTQTLTNLTGFLTNSGDPYSYVFIDIDGNGSPDLLYVASLGNAPSGVLKYSSADGGTTWVARGSLTDNAFGITGFYNCTNNTVELFITSNTANAKPNKLYKFTDVSGSGNITSNGSALNVVGTLLATAATNTAFLGVSFTPGTTIGRPATFDVTGGGTFCIGGSGVDIGLSDSETGVSYQLFNGPAIGAIVTGTGAALDFGLQTSPGTYTVVATNTLSGCTSTMHLFAVVTVSQLPPIPIITGNTLICPGSSTLLSTAMTPGYSYCWKKSSTPNSWQNVGSAEFSAGDAAYQSLAFYGNTPYVAYQDGSLGNKTTVMKFDGINWITVGSAGFSSGNSAYQSLAFFGNIPYVAFQDGSLLNKTTVMKFDGTNWVTVGTAGFSTGAAAYQRLAFNGSTPYVVYQDQAILNRTSVMKFDGTNWVAVGNPGFTNAASYQSIAFNGSNPYVAYQDNSVLQKTTVMKFDGLGWITVGSIGFSPGVSSYQSLAFNGSTPYVAFQDGANNFKTSVMKLNGINWVFEGAAGFSAGDAAYQSLVFNGSTPYVAYRDMSTGNKTSVMKFDGANWTVVGVTNFSSGQSSYQSLAFKGDVPYVAFRDLPQGLKTTVMKFDVPCESTTNTLVVSAAGIYTVIVTNASGCTSSNSVTVNVVDIDDGNICTEDGCNISSLTATHTLLPIENDNNPCTIDGCHSINGPTHTPDATYIPDDGNVCTTDYCDAAGNIHHDLLAIVDDFNPCTNDGCNSSTGEYHTPVADGTIYDDHNVCTVGDHCVSGSGVSGTLVVCNDQNPCTDDGCNSVTGCVFTNNDNNAYSDGNACTIGDHCSGGVGISGTPLVCNDNNPCTDDECIAATGCVYTNNDNNVYSDGNPCTVGDYCQNGTGHSGIGTLTCNDHNPCTDDDCVSMIGCVFTNNDNNAYSDGNACTIGDHCFGGVGISGTPLVCNDNNPCTDDECNPATGCVYTNNDNNIYSDGNPCTVGDYCQNGTGHSGTATLTCNDHNPCTDDNCVSMIGCVFTNNDNNAYSDGNACTTGDHCFGGVGISGTPLVCNDNNPCTDDECNPATGCVYTNNDNNLYSDGNACTTGDHCSGGVGISGTPLVCNDNNPCTDDECIAATGCVYTNNDNNLYSDGNACTIGDHCSGGVGISGTPLVCNDNNPCTDDECNPATGCVYTNNDNNVYSDGNACTTGDHCSGGVGISGTPLVCNDNNLCTDDECNPATGCVYTNNDNNIYSDGNACTIGDHCFGGVGISGTPLVCNDNNPCTDDECNAATGCVYTNNDNNVYSDGNACTTGDHCSGGVGVSGTPLICNDNNPCTDDECNPATGCVFTNNDNNIYSDGNPCTVGDYCQNGTGHPGTATLTCNDHNPCTDDDCVSMIGCVFTNNDNNMYSDGNACTTGDHCSGGVGISGTPLVCNDNNPCTDDECNAATGCVYTNNDNNLYSDGNACTIGDHCSGGVGVSGSPLICNDNNPCTDDECNPATGCVYTNNDNNLYSDGNTCTIGDHCSGGVGVSGTPLVCNDNNPCTDDECNAATGCVYTNNDNNVYSDGNACTTGDHCSGGVGVSGTPLICNDNNPCTDDECNPATGCVFTNNDNNIYSDGNACTIGDHCSGGVGVSGTPLICNDNNPCTDDECNAATGCVYTNNDNNLYSDGNACTIGDHCSGGVGVSGSPLICNDNNPCTDDECNPATGCVYTNNDNNLYSDGNTCTIGDHCSGGVGVSGTPLVCNDNNPCTDDECNAATGCVYTNNDNNVYSDGNACTTGDHCSGGVGVSGTPLICNDNNPCTDDECNPATGCVFTNNDNNIYSDGNACTIGDHCSGGVGVSGTPLICNDNNPCTDDECNPATGCVYTNNDNNIYSDGNPCTVGDYCQNGTGHSGTATLTCNDHNPCTDDDCVSMIGCVFTNNDNNVYSDGNACTTGDHCLNGIPIPGTSTACNDNNPCTDDACNPSTGLCVYTDDDSNIYSDNDLCTTGDHCLNGIPIPGTSTACNDNNPCTDDACNPSTGLCVYTDDDSNIYSDNDLCTTGDHCLNGIPIPGTSTACNDNNPCTDDACNPSTGLCVYTDDDSNIYSDNDLCTTGDHCLNGIPIPGTSTACNDNNPCTDDACNPSTGLCVYTNDDSNIYSDNDLCTTGDHCLNGIPIPGTSTACNDNNPCTDDACNPSTGLCVYTNDDSNIYSDNDLCTTGDHCLNGVPIPGTSIVCNDNNPCTDDACNPSTGLCVYTDDDSNIYSDNDLCTTGDHCLNGIPIPGTSTACNDNNPCTDDACNPSTGLCVYTDDDSNIYSDNDLCTTGDHCLNGVPIPGTSIVCNDNNPCTDDACNPSTGLCVYTDDDSNIYSDNDLCTTGDHCLNGIPIPGTSTACNDNNPCTDDACNPSTGLCVYTDDDSNIYSDNDLCTTGDHCLNGIPIPGTSTACNDNNPCTDDACNPSTGLCVYTDDDSNIYSDNDLCTTGDHCLNGVPIPGTSIVCNDNNPCTDDACNPSTGLCVYTDDDSNIYSDNDLCTTGDHCLNGIPIPGTSIVCNDNNPCTDDACNPSTGLCVYTDDDSNIYSDNDLCTTGDHCLNGVPIPGTSTVCNDNNPCTDDACIPSTGLCVYTNDDSNIYSDNDLCTTGDHCLNGVPIPGTSTVCNDNNPCTDDACIPSTGLCVYTNDDSNIYSDNNLCTTGDHCLNGVPIPGTSTACNDNNPCTDDACNPSTGLCVYTNDDSNIYSDNNLCTTGDHCLNGIPIPGTSTACNDNNPCTDDACNPSTGLCVYTNDDSNIYSDNDLCTTGDHCLNGIPIPGTSTACNDNNPCTDDACNPSTGLCVYTNDDSNIYSDNDLCTTGDHCLNGIPIPGTSIVCNDNNPCTDDACNPSTGLCVYTDDDSNIYSDNDLCTTGDHCLNGIPIPGTSTACNDNNPCTDDACNPSTGLCVYTDDDSNIYSDNDLCTTGDHCLNGVPIPGTSIVCNDNNPCTDDACNPSTGLCVYTDDDSNIYSDNDLCTTGDHCLNGIPIPGTSTACNDNNPCTDDACNPSTGLCVYTDDDSNIYSDNDLCTTGDHCLNGIPIPGTSTACNDNNPCTDDACNPSTGLCVYTNDDSNIYSDNDLCTTGDHCLNGVPIPGTSIVCNDNNPCTDDACNPSTGLCVYTDDDSNIYSDNDLCTTGDHCVNGVPIPGISTVCNDNNPCTDDACNPSTGLCVYTDDDSNIYSDNDLCTTGDHCLNGVPIPGTSTACNDNNPCTDDACNPSTGLCVYTNNDNNSFDDNNPCTTGDNCLNGVAIPGIAVDCNDNNPCTDDACDPATGICINTKLTGPCTTCLPGFSCFDGNPQSNTPTSGTITGSSSVCYGNWTMLLLVAASTDSDVVYQWHAGPNPGGPYPIILGNNTLQNTDTLRVNTYFQATVSFTRPGGGSVTTAEFEVVVNPLPVVSVSPGSGIICNPGGTSISLSAVGALSFSWSPTIGLSSNVGSTVTANPAVSTVYVVTGTDANGCVATASADITIDNTLANLVATSTYSMVCSGGISQLNVSVPTGPGISYLWSPTTVLDDPTIQNPIAANPPQGITLYTVTVTNGICTATATTSITVGQALVGFAATIENETACSGTTFTVTAHSTGGGEPYSYSWNDGVGGVYPDSQSVVAILPDDQYTFDCTITDNCGATCSSSITIQVQPLVVPTANSNSPIIEGNTLFLTSSGGSSYSWTGPNGFTSTLQNPTILNVALVDSGTYTVNVTDTNGAWTQKANFGGGSRYYSVAFSIGNKGYIGTGYDGTAKQDFWEYDPSTDTWTQKANFGGIARYYATGLSIGNKGYIGLGLDQASYLQDFWEYDPLTNSWMQKANYGGQARIRAVGFCIGSKGYVGTGETAIYFNDFWEYDPSFDTWIQIADFAGTNRGAAVGFTIGNKGYLGTGWGGSHKRDFWEYDPASDLWTQKADFGGIGREFAAAFSIGNKGYIGTGADSFLQDFWEYNQSSDTWIQKSNFGGTARYGAAAFSIGNKGYIGTGYDGLSYNQDFWEYDPTARCASTAMTVVSVNPFIGNNITLNLKLFIQGYYQGAGLMNACLNTNGTIGFLPNVYSSNDADSIVVSAMDPVLFSEVDRQTTIVKTNGMASLTFGPSIVSGNTYYLKINHRNSIETWSANPVLMNSITTYDFTTDQTQAYGNNMVDVGLQFGEGPTWAFYGGDISDATTATVGLQDGVIESQDYGDMENAVYFTSLGYIFEDITGDGVVESADYGLIENNVYYTIFSMHP